MRDELANLGVVKIINANLSKEIATHCPEVSSTLLVAQKLICTLLVF